jgi:hypothetical protein
MERWRSGWPTPPAAKVYCRTVPQKKQKGPPFRRGGPNSLLVLVTREARKSFSSFQLPATHAPCVFARFPLLLSRD